MFGPRDTPAGTRQNDAPAAAAQSLDGRGPHQRSEASLSPFHIVPLALLGAVALTLPLYIFLPLSDGLRQVWYDAVAVGALAAGFLGLARNRPQRRRGWLLVLLGYGGWVLGDLVWTVEQHVLPERYPAPSDGFYLSAYVVLGAGALVFARSRRGGRDTSALLDAAIITAGVGVLAAVFLIVPVTVDSDLSPAGKLVGSAYPLGDLFLLGVIVRIYSAPGARAASYRLLMGSLALTLLTDVVYDVAIIVAGDPVSSSWMDAGWLGGYLLIAAAACLPSMRALAEPAPDPTQVAPSRYRLAALTGALMLPGLALIVDGANGGGLAWPVIGAGALLLSVLVLLRMVGLLHVLQVQSVRLAALAHSDALTGAPNRRTWDLEVSRACMTSRDLRTALSVAILDIDRFKSYNDANGHQAGDRLLREAVAAWSEALPADALLARYGGEEFAVLFPGVGAQTAAASLERLRAVTPDGQTFSAGVAVWDPATDPATAIAAADEALYAAKRAGRDRVVVHGPTSWTSPARHRPVADFTMVTQPVVDINTFRVTGHEALTRFTGTQAALGVQEVFRAAHLDGDGDLLELAAVRSALALPGRPAGHDLYVNVSARALTSQRFLDGLPTELDGIVVELSEHADDVALTEVAEAAARLRARGARIALDDVGAGAQEFARLARLRPDIVKIDRSLVQGCAYDPGNLAVLRALVTYADDMRLTLCAEGVEDTDDLRQLIALGITHAQGYLLGRPDNTWRQHVGNRAAPTPRTR